MSILKAVIGANYGDEGKGLMTDHLCGKALDDGSSCIVVCGNGGAQRGHTVETSDGKRFVFHHLGSGSLLGVPTHFCADFILNPMIFRDDWELLTDPDTGIGVFPQLSVDPGCRFSTPYDMIVNRILEDARGGKRHGSVGLGIWETVLRYERGHGITIREFAEMDRTLRSAYLRKVRSYCCDRLLEELGTQPSEFEAWAGIWDSELLIDNYLDDMEGLLAVAPLKSVQELSRYDIIVVENAQGVLLSRNYHGDNIHTTPSDTGAKQIRRLLDSGLSGFVTDIELDYVSRTYLTRHGAGPFPGECGKTDIAPDMQDLTNVPNDYQGTIRYGHLDTGELIDRIVEDRLDMGGYDSRTVLTMTHCNECPPDMDMLKGRTAQAGITLQLTAGHTRNDVHEAR